MSRENWWLDYVEKEVDEMTRQEMKSLLRHSESDQELVKSLEGTKSLLKDSAKPLPDFDAILMNRLHDKIMARVAETVMQQPSRFQLKAHHRRWIQSSVTGIALMLTFLLSGPFVSNKSLNTQWDISRQMAEEAQEKPEDLASLMTYQSEHDFLVDVASQSLDHLTKEQFESFLKASEMKTR